MRFLTSTTTRTAALCGMFLLAGCAAEEDTSGVILPMQLGGPEAAVSAAASEIGQKVCAEAIAHLEKNGAETECDAALIADCANVVGLLSDTYVVSIDGCLQEGGSPAFCFRDATFDLQPTKAHHELAESYCNDCLFGLDACEEIFYFGSDDKFGLGTVTLPFSDDIIRQVADECTDDLFCAADLPACAQDVLMSNLIPERTLVCLLNPFKGL